MTVVILDGRNFETKEELHRELRKVLDLPDYYGRNLDALWDCLTAWVGLPLSIHWTNFGVSKAKLGSSAIDLLELFLEAKEEIQGFDILISN